MLYCVDRPRAQDFNTPPGFVCGAYMLKCLDRYVLIARCFHELMHSFPRTALFGCLMLHPGCLSLWGPDCRSWSIASRATSMRSLLNCAMGVGYDFVVLGNLMVSRWGSVLWTCIFSKLRCFLLYWNPCFTQSTCFLHDCPGWSFAFFVFYRCMATFLWNNPGSWWQLLFCFAISCRLCFCAMCLSWRQSILFEYFRWNWFEEKVCHVSCLHDFLRLVFWWTYCIWNVVIS